LIHFCSVQSIDEFVTGQLAAWEVPGCAVAAVRDGDVDLAAGCGHRDQAAETPVTKDTLFAIGSVTKAFTVAAVGALVDDGLLEWERPLQDYLPGLRLHDPVVTGRVTITDLLAHRSGLPRHDLAWIGHPDRSRADLVRRLRFLPLSRDLRQQFQYCNLGYLVAGHLVEALSGMPWEEYTRSRLLTPLGMGRSNLSVGEMLTDPDHATAYERRSGVVVPVPARPVTALAPAGAINSSDGGAAAQPAHADTRGPDVSRLDPARLRAGLADRPVPRAPGSQSTAAASTGSRPSACCCPTTASASSC
jgi:CubicO group peptidase (beta-lactamase class C family)